MNDAASVRGQKILEKRRTLLQAREDVRHAEYELAKCQAWLAFLESGRALAELDDLMEYLKARA